VGGYDGASRQCLSTVECYNPETDTWHPVAEMSARRSGAGEQYEGGKINRIFFLLCIMNALQAFLNASFMLQSQLHFTNLDYTEFIIFHSKIPIHCQKDKGMHVKKKMK
jgi:hypothetical protein